MATSTEPCRVIASNREVIEHKLLMPKSFREKEFLLSLRQLRQEAFR